jgi:hypothetical protein
MSNYYLDLPCIGEVPQAYRADSSELMAVSGLNIGNFAFRHALRFILADFDTYSPVRYPAYHQAAQRGDVEKCIVSCANWLGTSIQDEASNLNRARAFEATDAPTICFGLGVQAQAGESNPELGLNTRRLAKALSARATLVSVRDELTRRTLERIGITNVVVTGCPSNFINPDPKLGERIITHAKELRGQARSWKDIRSVLSEFSGGHTASGTVLRESLRLMADAPAFLVVQAPTLLPFLLRETNEIPPPYLANNPFAPDVDRLRKLLRTSTLHFSSVEAWLDFSRTCHITFGMRIHGTMIPLQAGVPAILISHDSRTAGLASHMGVPMFPAEEFGDICHDGPDKMLDSIVQQMEGYDARRATLAGVMVDYLRENALEPHPALEKLAGCA